MERIMSMAFTYPQSRYEPDKLVDLSDRAERERLSKSALIAYFNIAREWQLRDEDARELLGGLSSSSWYEWKKKPDRLLDVDRITRISYLIGIYKSLHILHGEELANRWVSMPNKNVIFGGRTPLEMMSAGGLLAMQTVRQLLDARRGGL
jgi:hypothetical protein